MTEEATQNDRSVKFLNSAIQTTSWKSYLFAWICMILSILSGASVGPIFKFMELRHISAALAASWRCQVMILFLSPIALIERYSEPQNCVDYFASKPDLPFRIIWHVMIAGVAWALNLLLWVSGIEYTSTVRANIFACLYPLMLVIWLHFTSVETERPNKLEWLGTIVALCGVITVSARSLISATSGSLEGEAIGDLLCTGAAAAEVLVILNRFRIKKYVPLWQYTAITTFVVIIASSLLSMIMHGTQVFCLGDNCVFGWASKEWIHMMIPFGAVIGLLCLPGVNYAIQYLPPLLFSSFNLLDPILTGIISWAAGLEGVPDIFTWIGGGVVICGSGVISYGGQVRQSQSESKGNNMKADMTHHHAGVEMINTNAFVDDNVKVNDDNDNNNNNNNDNNGNININISNGNFSYSKLRKEEEEEDDDDNGDVNDNGDDDVELQRNQSDAMMMETQAILPSYDKQ